MIQLSFFIFFHHTQRKIFRPVKVLFILLFLLLTIETLRGVIFDARRVINFGREEYSWQYEYRFQQYAESIIQKEKQKQPFSKVVVGGPFYYMNHRISLYSGAALLQNPESINDLSSLSAKEPVLLLVLLPEKDFSTYESFLSVKGKEVAGQFNGLYFYSVYVSPH